jgi:predicted NUDIX family phosphoesterase
MGSSQFLWMAETVLRRYRRSMSPSELWDFAKSDGLANDSWTGTTPWKTMDSKLSTDIRRKGTASKFVRTARGRFYLRELLVQSNKREYYAPPWEPPPTSERVIVFPTKVLDAVGRFQGIRRDYRRIYRALFRSGVCTDMNRAEAELDDDHKQVVTYVLVQKGDSLLVFRRGSYNRTDQMLRGSDCVGFGGHVSNADYDLFVSDDIGLISSAARELGEELSLPQYDRQRLARCEGISVIGVLNDDSSAVGRRHFAVILRYEVADSDFWDHPVRGEESITRLRWIDTRSQKISLEEFEYWSQLVLRTFAPAVVSLQPQYRIRRARPLRPPHILCIVGQIGSGKTEASDVLVKEYGYAAVNSGRVLAQLIGLRPLPQTPRLEFQEAATTFISDRDGPDRLAYALVAEAKAIGGNGRTLIDGVRHRATLDAIRQAARPIRVGVIYVASTPDVAYRFYRQRELPGASITDFLLVRESPDQAEVGMLLNEADAVLHNWFGRSRYVAVVRSLMAELGVARRANFEELGVRRGGAARSAARTRGAAPRRKALP